jgi:hypothetical protein
MNMQCGRCGYPISGGSGFCRNCGAMLGLSPVAPLRQKSRNPIILSITAFALIVALVLGLWKPGFLWTLQNATGWPPRVSEKDRGPEGLIVEKAVYNPSEIPVSGTPAFSVSPAEGFTVSAEKNALDRERTFTITPFSEKELGALFLNRPMDEWVPLMAFELDAGLKDHERLPGKLKVDLDLKKLGVPKELWPYLNVLRFGDDGSMTQLPVFPTGKGISYETRQNSFFAVAIGLSLGIPVMLVKESMQHSLREQYPDTPFYQVHHSLLKGTKAQYKVIFPETLAGTKEWEQEKKALEKKKQALMESYGLNPDLSLIDAVREACASLGSNPEYQDVDIEIAAARFMRKVTQDPAYLEIQKTLNDPAWQMRFLCPDSVKLVCSHLVAADNYLFEERGFRVPTHVIEVAVIERWTYGPEVLGISENLYSSSPRIRVNANKTTSNSGELLVTMTHELFHVAQSGYVYFDSDNYIPFWEATAVLLEREAFAYFGNKGLLNSGDASALTLRDHWENFDKSLMTPSIWQNLAGPKEEYFSHHGYVASYWIEFLQKRYGGDKTFLVQLMQRFASNLEADVHKVLMNHTSSSQAAYCHDFRVFCSQNYKTISSSGVNITPPLPEISLDADTPFAHIEGPYQAFSTRVRNIKILVSDEKGEAQRYKILVKGGTSPGGATIPFLRLHQAGDFKGQLASDRNSMLLLPESTSRFLEIHEIEDQFMTAPGVTVGKGYKYTISLMLPPKMPTVELDSEKKLMLVSPVNFRRSNEASSGYDVVITAADGKEHRFPQRIDTATAEIPFDKLPSGKKSESDETGYTVHIVECIKMDGGKTEYGPDGEKYTQDDTLLFEDILGSYDIRQDVSGFKSEAIDSLLALLKGVEGVPGMEEYVEQYKKELEKYMATTDGTYTGTMVITRVQPEEEIAEIKFVVPNTDLDTVLFRGRWKDSALYLDAVGGVAGGAWTLYFKKEGKAITCEGNSTYESTVASYTFSLTGTKQD